MSSKADPDGVRVVCTHRKARFDYEILEVFEAGIALRGTEVKALRQGRASLAGAYVLLEEGEAFLKGAEIQEYSHGNRSNHEPKRVRKLLLTRRELSRLAGSCRERGLAVVPLRIYFRGPYAKVEIALARGKKQRDKREAIRKREAEREIRRRERG